MASTITPPWFPVTGSAKASLVAAAQTWENTKVSEQYIQQALAQPDVELDVLISAYRYYFYKNNNDRALEMAVAVCDRIQKNNQWPTDWESLKPLLISRLDEATVRIYLSAYAASGLLLGRLGRLETAQMIARNVKQIDAKEFGGELLLNILQFTEEEKD
ncbi:MAG: hypothetical protein AAF821_21410 [Cyanobacteria bacterium P01_D01_bin.156]